MKLPVLILAAALAAGLATSAAARNDARLASLESESTGLLGVHAVHLETGDTISLNSDERFQMMSVFKLPIALALLHLVDTPAMTLTTPIRIEASDLRPGLSPIAERYPHGGVTLTVGDLLEQMVVESDNAASAIDVSRSELDLWQAFNGIPSLGPRAEWSLEYFDRLAASIPAVTRHTAQGRFADDPHNQATPAAMAALLVRVYRGEALSAAGTTRSRSS